MAFVINPGFPDAVADHRGIDIGAVRLKMEAILPGSRGISFQDQLPERVFPGRQGCPGRQYGSLVADPDTGLPAQLAGPGRNGLEIA